MNIHNGVRKLLDECIENIFETYEVDDQVAVPFRQSVMDKMNKALKERERAMKKTSTVLVEPLNRELAQRVMHMEEELERMSETLQMKRETVSKSVVATLEKEWEMSKEDQAQEKTVNPRKRKFTKSEKYVQNLQQLKSVLEEHQLLCDSLNDHIPEIVNKLSTTVSTVKNGIALYQNELDKIMAGEDVEIDKTKKVQQQQETPKKSVKYSSNKRRKSVSSSSEDSSSRKNSRRVLSQQEPNVVTMHLPSGSAMKSSKRKTPRRQSSGKSVPSAEDEQERREFEEALLKKAASRKHQLVTRTPVKKTGDTPSKAVNDENSLSARCLRA